MRTRLQKSEREVLPVSNTQGEITNPVACWATKGHWPSVYAFFTSGMGPQRMLQARIEDAVRGEVTCQTQTGQTSSAGLSRYMKCIPYKSPTYPAQLEELGGFMESSGQGIALGSRLLCNVLLEAAQDLPQASIYIDAAAFEMLCERIRHRNESRLLKSITPLLVPSGEDLAITSFSELQYLVESVHEGWTNCIPLTQLRPQPAYSIGFGRKAYTKDQLARLRPFVGDRAAKDRSFFMATHYMFFPFLTCEVKCGTVGLETADKQNAHSMTLALRGIVHPFRQVHREKELHRRIIAFSISHDNAQIRLYGHYAEINGQTTKYYRYRIKEFNFTSEEHKWISYCFTTTTYTDWVPQHLRRLCSAIDFLPITNESAFDPFKYSTVCYSWLLLLLPSFIRRSALGKCIMKFLLPCK